MKLKRIISVALVVVMTAAICTVSTISSSAASNPTRYETAAHEIDSEYAYDGQDLGATYSPEQTTFKVWSPTGTKCTLNLYATGSDDEEGAKSLGTYEMTKDETKGIFSVTVEKDLKNVYYTYTITAKSIGTDKETTKETADVYSIAAGVNGKRSMVCDLDSTDPEGWDKDTHVITDDITDASVWELHVKDFSYDENSGVSEANRGKYLAFTENGTTLNNAGEVSTCIDYLKELGITYVQLNPIYDFGSVDEAGDDSQFNWGYDPVNYNVPEGSYSSNPYDGNTRITELKQMIQALHNAGIGVIMDVVYNHTYSTDSSFQACVPDYYYRLKDNGELSSGSGCGNDTASERAMFRNFMIQSTKYWAEEYHVDGFRFDLMGLHDVETMNQIRSSLDTIDTGMIMYGEGWALSTTSDVKDCTGATTRMASQGSSKYLDTRIGMFNDQFRDGMKGSYSSGTATGFVQGASSCASSVKYGIRANVVGSAGAWKAYAPSQCVNYVSCHDNNTLYDKLVMSMKVGSTDFRTRDEDVVQVNKFTETIAATSQGVHFMLAGEEMGRSKDGDENSYKSAATENMIDWSNIVEFQDLVSYYKGMMDIRKAFSPFTSDNSAVSQTQYTLTSGITVNDAAFGYIISNTAKDEWNKVAVVLNSSTSNSNIVSLANDKSITEDTEWVVLADGNEAGLTPIKTVTGKEINVPASSAMVLVEKSTYEKANITNNRSKVKVISRDSETNQVISTKVLYGTVGTKYTTEADSTLDSEYNLDKVVGDAKGTFEATDKTVEYIYSRYVPDSLKTTLTGNSKLTVKDATIIQKYLVSAVELTDEQIATADYNCSGTVDVTDATMIQKFVAHDDYGAVNTLTIKYLSAETKKQIATAKTVKTVAGKSGTFEPISIIGYKYVSNSAGTDKAISVDYDFTNKTIEFYYDEDNYDVTLHVKHSSGSGFQPSLWAWHDGGNIYSSWPGKRMTADSDGWYTESFVVPNGLSYSVIISDGGTNQTKDYDGFTASELWAVIDDSNLTSGSYLTFSTTNPDNA
jgi:type I pullulanase